MIIQLKIDVTHAWGATQNLAFGTSWLLNGFILQNCCKLCKTTKASHLTAENSREEWKMFLREETEKNKNIT